MGELGFFGSVIPEKYGGSGLGFLAMVLITEEVARVHSAVRVAINMRSAPRWRFCSSAVRSKDKMDPAVVAR
jgi:glutaryl-CoA dehydrogenase (non-decarboxylating)